MSPSLVGRPRRRRAQPGRLAQKIQVHGQLADLALEPIDNLLTLRLVFFRPGSQAILRG
jgi:hypothetical protein